MKKLPIALLVLSCCLAGCTDNGVLLKSSGKNYVSMDANGIYKIGTPYQVNNIWYYPQEDMSYREVGIASWYGPDFHNGLTANGEKYDMHAMTAAHRTLPLPSIAKVTNLENGKSVIVRINDRGPFVNNRIIDVSKTAAEVLDFKDKGTAKVRVEIMAEESKELKKQILKNGGKVVGGPPLPPLSDLQGTTEPNDVSSPIPLANPMPETIASSNVSDLEPVKPVTAAPVGETTVPVNKPVFGTASAGYYVQVGAFSKLENAQNLQSELTPFGQVQILEKTTPDTVLFRVRLGPYDDPQKAVETIDLLERRGFGEARLVQEIGK